MHHYESLCLNIGQLIRIRGNQMGSDGETGGGPRQWTILYLET